MTAPMEKSGAVALMEREASAPRRICFVCTGNTCRSPMAQAVANHLARAEGIGIEAFSAGLYAFEGDPIAPNAADALEEAGILPTPQHDYHTHLAHNLSEEEAQGYDLLIGMTPTHVLELTMRHPALALRIRCMPHPIPDPFGGDPDVYRSCLEEITQGVRDLLLAEEAE